MAENVINCPYCITGVVNKLTATCDNSVCKHAFNKKDLRRIVTGKYVVDPRFVIATKEDVETVKATEEIAATITNTDVSEVVTEVSTVEETVIESLDVSNITNTVCETEVTNEIPEIKLEEKVHKPADIIDAPTLVTTNNVPGLKKPKIKSTRNYEEEARLKEEREAKEREEREAREREEREAREREEREAREREEREAKEREEREAREREEREAKEREEREAREREEREAKERQEREAKEREEREAKERQEREAKEREEREAKEREAKEREAREAEEARKAIIAEKLAERLENERLAREEKKRQEELEEKMRKAQEEADAAEQARLDEEAEIEAIVEKQFKEALAEQYGDDVSVVEQEQASVVSKADMINSMTKRLAVNEIPDDIEYSSDDDDFDEDTYEDEVYDDSYDEVEEEEIEPTLMAKANQKNVGTSTEKKNLNLLSDDEEDANEEKAKKISPAEKARNILKKNKAAKDEWVEGDVDIDFNKDGYYNDTPVADKTEPSFISIVDITKMGSLVACMVLFTIFLIYKG